MSGFIDPSIVTKYVIVLFQDVSVGGSTCGRANMKLIRTLLDELAGEPFVGRTVDVLGDTVSSQKTPVRFPSLLSKFRYVCVCFSQHFDVNRN